MLTALTTSTSEYMTTLSSMKAQMGMTTTQDDDVLDDNILAAGHAVANYVGYWPLRQYYSETLAGYGSLRLMVSATPIRAVSEIRIDTNLVDPATYYVQQPLAGIIHRDKGWPWTAGVEWDLEAHVTPNSELKRFTVKYEAGWVLTTSTGDLTASGFITSSGGRTLPRDFEQAVQEEAKSMFLSRKRDSSIIEKRVGALSVVYGSRVANQVIEPLCPAAMDLLQNYRRIK